MTARGRGVVLIGHSQGSGVLTQLMRNEIDGKPVQDRLVSALLLGTNVAVPEEGCWRSIQEHSVVPHCIANRMRNCVCFVPFQCATSGEQSVWPRAGDDMVSACVNPAALSGGSGELHAYLSTANRAGASAQPPYAWINAKASTTPIDTPFVSLPGLLTAECVTNDKSSWQ